MDVLLTPFVNRLLRRFIKRAAGEETSQLRVSLSRGSVALHNLELNLDELTARLPVSVKRAFARQLTITVPWTSFASQPLQVTLDTVEVILVLNAAHTAEDELSVPQEGSKDAGRFGSLTNLLLRTLFDTKVTVRNVVIKFESPVTVATFTCHSILIATALDDWRSNFEEPQDWLKKVLELQHPALSLDGRFSSNSAPAFQAPVLRTASLQVAAVVPVFAILDPQRRRLAAPAYHSHIEASIGWLDAQLTNQQLQWLITFAACLLSVVSHNAGASSRPVATLSRASSSPTVPYVRGEPMPATLRRTAAPLPAARRRSALGIGWLSSAAMAAVSDVWDYVVDEAAAAEAAPQLASSKPAIDVSIGVTLAGGKLLFGLVERMTSPMGTKQSSSMPSASPRHDQQPPASPSPAPAADHGQLMPSVSTPDAAASQPATPSHKALPPAAAAALEEIKLSMQHTQPPVSRPDTPSVPPHVFAMLQWHKLNIFTEISQQILRAVEVSLATFSMQRRVSEHILSGMASRPGQDWVADEVFGVHPLNGTEILTMQDSEAPNVAVLARWQQEGDIRQAVHLQAGQVAFTHAAGFLACLWQFLRPAFQPAAPLAAPSGVAAPVESPSVRIADSASSSPWGAAADAQISEHVSPLPARFAGMLQGSLALSASIGSVQVACLSGMGSSAAGLLVSMDRLSARLGAIRVALRPGSLAARLHDMASEGAPEQGLRMSILGLQVGTSTAWDSRASSAEGLCKGLEWCTNSIEVQAVASAQMCEQPADNNTSTHLAMAAISSHIQTHMPAAQVAAALGVIDALAAESRRRFKAPLPGRGTPALQQGQPFRTAWLSAVAFEADELRLTCTSAGDTAPERTQRIALQLGSVILAAMCSSQALEQHSMAVHVPELHIAALQACTTISAAAADVRLAEAVTSATPWGAFSMPPLPKLAPIRTGSSVDLHAQAAPQRFSPCPAARLEAAASIVQAAEFQLSIAVCSEAAELPPDTVTPVQLSVSLQQASVVCTPQQLSMLSCLAAESASRPALPTIPTYPPAALTAGPAINVSVTVSWVSWQLSGGNSTVASVCSSCLAGHLVNVGCQIRSKITWDPGTDLDALGFPMQPPLLDIKMTTSVMEAEVSTIHPDLVIKPPPCIRIADMQQHGEACRGVQVSLTMVQGGIGGRSSLQVTVAVPDVQFKLSPIVAAAVASILSLTWPSNFRPAPRPQQRKPGLETQVRVTVSSLQANAQSLLPGSGTDIASLQLSTADCVLNFYTSLRADAQLFTSEHPAAPHASHMDILLVAVMVEMQAARERVAVLMPANWHAAGIAVAGLLQLRLDAAFLPVHISIEGLSAGRSLLADFSQHLQAAVPIDTCKDQSSASTPQDANRQPDDIWADDLRCGLFNVLTEATQDPGVMEISWGKETVGIWSAHTEAWLTWRYPHPRAVLLLCTATAPDLQLGACPEGQGGFTLVELVPASAVHGVSAVNSHALLAKGSQPAELWQLRWTVPANSSGLDAASVACKTCINPCLISSPVPLRPLAPPIIARLDVEHVDAVLLGRSHPEAACLQEMIICSLHLLQVAMHAWKDGATSTLIQAEPLLAMAEAASLTVQTLLRGSTCSILVMHASERAARGSASKGTRPDEQAGMLKTAAISLANDGIPLPALSEPGLSVSFRSVGEPCGVHLSELCIHQMQQLLRMLSRDVQQQQQRPATEDTGAPPVGRSLPLHSQPAEPFAVTVHNHCPLDIAFRQEGTCELISLAPAESVGYSWAQAPMADTHAIRQLQLSGQEPAGSQHQDAVLAFSAAFDAMSQGTCRRDMQWPGGVLGSIVVSVCKESLQWHVHIRPGHAISNATSHVLHVCYIGPMLAPTIPEAASGAVPQQDDSLPPLLRSELMMELQPCQVGAVPSLSDFLVLRAAHAVSQPQATVQVWLGGGGGWSLPLPMTGPQSQAAAAGGFSKETPASPIVQQAAMPQIICSVADPDAGSCQTVLRLQPALTLFNGMPCALQWQIQHLPQFLGQDSEARSVQSALLQPDQETPLDATCNQQETLSLRLAEHAAPAADSSPAASPDEQPVKQHGHRLSWTWRAFAPLSPAEEHVSRADGWSTKLVTAVPMTQTAPLQWHDHGKGDNIPKPGQHKDITLLWHGKPLLCLLAVRQPQPDCPCLTLEVRPYAVLRNSMRYAVVLEAGTMRTLAPPGAAVPFCWPPQQQRPRTAFITVRSRTTEGVYVALRSAAFSLEPGTAVPLDCSQTAAGANPVAILQERLWLPVALQVAAESPAGAPQSKSLSSLVISAAAGMSISNITPWTLLLAPSPILDAPSLPFFLGPGSAADLQPVWSLQSSSVYSSAESAVPAVQITAGKDSGSSAGACSRAVHIPISRSNSRQRAMLQLPDSSFAMLTYRVLASAGHLHLVLFVDCQPPLVFHNLLEDAFEVHLCPEDADESAAACSAQPLLIPAYGQLQWDLNTAVSGMASTVDSEDQEDEDAFLRHITGVKPPNVISVVTMQLRRRGAQAWSQPCSLSPGRYSAGLVQIEVKVAGASVHVEITTDDSALSVEYEADKGRLPRHDSSSLLSELNQPAEKPCSLLFYFQDLQVSVWDDERRHLRGPACDSCQSSSPAETFMFSFKDISIQLSRDLNRAQHRSLAADACLRGMQVDMHLEGSNYPVICMSLAQRSFSAPTSQTAPFISMLVHQYVLPAEHASLVNTWVEDCSIELPPLLVSVDDHLLALAGRVMRLLKNALIAQPKDAAMALPHALTGTPAAVSLQDMHVLSSASSAMAHQSMASDVSELASPAPAEQQRLLLAEAAAAAAPRLLVRRLHVGGLQLICEVHISAETARLPLGIDTHRAPVNLPKLGGEGLLFRVPVMVQALLAYMTAEALLNAPRLLGSLEVLFNPVGLMTSVSIGFQDMLALPLAAIEARSASQFAAGLGLGGASLLRHLSSWTLNSVSGFSGAVANVLQRSLAANASTRALAVRHPAPAQLQQGLTQGLTGLAGSVTAGISGVFTAPIAAYHDGTGMLAGTGRGLLGVVGLPLSGALDLVSSLSAGLATSTGIDAAAVLCRPPHDLEYLAVRHSQSRLVRLLMAHLGTATIFRPEAMSWVPAISVVMLASTAHASPIAVPLPLLLLIHGPGGSMSASLLAVFSQGGGRLMASMPLQGLQLRQQPAARRLLVQGAPNHAASQGCSAATQAAQLHMQVVLGHSAWQSWLPTLLGLLECR